MQAHTMSKCYVMIQISKSITERICEHQQLKIKAAVLKAHVANQVKLDIKHRMTILCTCDMIVLTDLSNSDNASCSLSKLFQQFLVSKQHS